MSLNLHKCSVFMIYLHKQRVTFETVRRAATSSTGARVVSTQTEANSGEVWTPTPASDVVECLVRKYASFLKDGHIYTSYLSLEMFCFSPVALVNGYLFTCRVMLLLVSKLRLAKISKSCLD